MAIAKVFMSGNSQAVRLPKEFRLEADEVEVSRHGQSLLLTPSSKPCGMRVLDLLHELSELIDIPEDSPPQERKGL